MHVVTFSQIRDLRISPRVCLRWVEEAIRAKPTAQLPSKVSLKPMERSFCNVMPSLVWVDGKRWGGVKVVTRYPGKTPSLQSQILLFDAETGQMVAFMDADWITAMRTGAVAVHSIGLLAKQEFSTLAFMGLGNTARATMLVLSEQERERPLKVKLLAYKGQERDFAERFSHVGNMKFETVSTYDELVRGSDVVVSAATYLDHDIAADDAYAPGVLVVPIHTRGFTNCDLVFDKVFADDTAHVCHFGYFDSFRSFAEVSEVVRGEKPGRENDCERIVVYNIGVAMHDVYFAAKIYGMLDAEELEVISFGQPEQKFWV